MERTRPPETDAADLIAGQGRKYIKYIWWEPIGGVPLSAERMVAQVMNLGIYDDIRRLEWALGPEALVGIMAAAQPG